MSGQTSAPHADPAEAKKKGDNNADQIVFSSERTTGQRNLTNTGGDINNQNPDFAKAKKK